MNACRTGLLKDPLCHTWASYTQNRDNTTRGFLIEHYLPLVRATAARIHGKLSKNVELDDLVSAGTFGLMDAVEAFDPARVIKFETYGAPRIRGAILDELRSMDWAPRLVRRRARELAAATQALQGCLGRSPSDDDLSEHMGLSLEDLREVQRDAHAVAMTSLDPSMERGGDRQIQAVDWIADQRVEDPTIGAMRNDIRETVVRGLSRTERLVILLYYFEDMTLKEIGLTLKLSESRVSQIHAAILAGLREDLAGRTAELYAAVSEVRNGGARVHQ